MKTLNPEALSAASPRIAVVEDDADLLASMLDYLHVLGYPAWGVGSAEAFYKQLHMSPVDVLVLDIGLPGEDGLQLAAWLHQRVDLAVIIVSARDRLQDRLDGLAAGADRYLVKPVDLAELVANIDAAWRRSATTAAANATTDPTPGQWRLDAVNWRLHSPAGPDIHLTSHEFCLLKTLIDAGGDVVPRSALIDLVFGRYSITGPNRLDVLVARLRAKIRRGGDEELPLQTAHGVGYALPGAVLTDSAGASPGRHPVRALSVRLARG